jgi:hypothetical protein
MQGYKLSLGDSAADVGRVGNPGAGRYAFTVNGNTTSIGSIVTIAALCSSLSRRAGITEPLEVVALLPLRRRGMLRHHDGFGFPRLSRSSYM